MSVSMQVSVENLSNIEKRLSITLPATEIDSEVLDRLHKLAPKVKIAGFRQGKIPFNVIQKRYEPSVHGEVVAEKIKESYIAALEKEKLNPAGFPKIDVIPPSPASKENFVYTATIELYPEIKLVDFSQLEVDKVKSEITEQDVEDTLQNIRKQLAIWNDITTKEHKIQTDDKVTVDFTAKVRCEPPKEEQEKDVKFTMGSGEMWKEFEENMLGKSLGDEVNFSLTFPDSHIDKDVANKTADFTVKINKISSAELPEINEELAKKCGVQEGGADALRAHIKERMEKELVMALKEIYRNNIVTKTIALQPVDVPKVLVEEEIKRRQEKMHQELKKWLKMKDVPIPERQRFEEAAKSSVAIGLIFTEIAKANNLNADEQKVKAKVEELAKTYHDPQTLINWCYSDPKHLSHISAEVLEDEIFAYLEQKAKITEKSLSYKEVVALRKH